MGLNTHGQCNEFTIIVLEKRLQIVTNLIQLPSHRIYSLAIVTFGIGARVFWRNLREAYAQQWTSMG